MTKSIKKELLKIHRQNRNLLHYLPVGEYIPGAMSRKKVSKPRPHKGFRARLLKANFVFIYPRIKYAIGCANVIGSTAAVAGAALHLPKLAADNAAAQ